MRKTALLIIIAAVLSAGFTYTLMKGKTTSPPVAEHAGEETAQVPEISGLKTEFAVAGQSWDQIAATGKVGPNVNKVVKIGPRISGKIVRVHANVGDSVGQGQVLATMSSVELAEARAAYRLAAAKLRASKDSYARQAKLAKLGAFSKRPVEEARSEFTSAQGDLAQAKSELAQNKSELVRAESELAQCVSRLERARELYKDQIISRQDLESAEAEFKRDTADVDTAKARIRQTEAKIHQVDAQAGIAKTYLNREEKVLGGNHLASRELQSAKAELTAAQLELRAAADTISVLGASPGGSGDTIAITSPMSGKVVSRAVNLGEMVEPSSTLFTVMNLADVWVEADVYEKDLSKIKKGQITQIRVSSQADRVFTGKVSYIGDILDPESRTAKIRCAVSNPSGLLKPEMFATISIITAKRGGAVLVAREAVLDDAGKKIVFVRCMECEEDKKAGTNACGSWDRREVELGSVHGGKVEVASGIEPGEDVVTSGAYQLKTALGSGALEAGCTDH